MEGSGATGGAGGAKRGGCAAWCRKPYQFMALEEFEPEDPVGPNDVVDALKEHTTSTGIPHIHHSRGN